VSAGPGAHQFALQLVLPLDRFTLEVAWESAERSLGIFGPSGSGKTSLLEAIAGLRPQARGVLRLDGVPWMDTGRGIRLPPERRGVGLVPQDVLLFPHLDVLGNLLAGRGRAERSASPRVPVQRILEVLELEDLVRRDVATLSGGERQRVALGRALCSGPGLLLLDEPLVGLDPPLRRRILSLLLRIGEEFALPTIHVSHDATELTLLCRDVIVLDAGRVLARGRPGELFTRPSILPIARAEGFENILTGRVTAIAEHSATVELAPGLDLVVPMEGLGVGRQATIGLRAEDLILALQPTEGLSAQNALSGTLKELREPAPADGPILAMIELGHGGPPLVAAITRQSIRKLSLAPGMSLHVVFKTQACHVLAAI
jgi:molybdate transport system ATP-binding protein